MAMLVINRMNQPETTTKRDLSDPAVQLELIESSNWGIWMRSFPTEKALELLLAHEAHGGWECNTTSIEWNDPENKAAEIEQIRRVFDEANAKHWADIDARDQQDDPDGAPTYEEIAHDPGKKSA
jgi:hypothetical protein